MHSSPRQLAGLLTLLSCVIFADGGVRAQEESTEEPGVGIQQPALDNDLRIDRDMFVERSLRVRPRMELEQRFLVGSDFDEAELGSYRTELSARVNLPLSKVVGLRISAGTGFQAYTIDGDRRFLDTGPTSSDAFDYSFTHGLRLDGQVLFTESLSGVAGGFVRASYERGARFLDGVRGGGFLGVSWHWRDRLTLIVGLGVASRFDRGVGLSPLVQVVWRVRDRLTLQSDGAGARLTWEVDDALELYLVGRIEGSTYRMRDRGGSFGAGSLRERMVPVTAGLRWKLDKQLRIEAYAGAVVKHELKSRDSSGETIDRETADGAAFFGRLTLRYRF